MESNQDTIYHKLNTRRLELTLLSRIVTTNFLLRWYTNSAHLFKFDPKLHSRAIYRLAKYLRTGSAASWESAASGLDINLPLVTCYLETSCETFTWALHGEWGENRTDLLVTLIKVALNPPLGWDGCICQSCLQSDDRRGKESGTHTHLSNAYY